MKKYIKKTFVSFIEECDLDLILQDEILGENEDGHDYEIIHDKKIENGYYIDEAQTISIDTLLEILNNLKRDGATHVQMFNHNDHHAYEFYGFEIRKAIQNEISEYNKLNAEQLDREKQRDIQRLEKELEILKNKK